MGGGKGLPVEPIPSVDRFDRARPFGGDLHHRSHVWLITAGILITGGGSFVESTRDDWERTFNVCWNGVYLVSRTFLPMLLASDRGRIVNVSSGNALRACRSPATACVEPRAATRLGGTQFS